MQPEKNICINIHINQIRHKGNYNDLSDCQWWLHHYITAKFFRLSKSCWSRNDSSFFLTFCIINRSVFVTVSMLYNRLKNSYKCLFYTKIRKREEEREWKKNYTGRRKSTCKAVDPAEYSAHVCHVWCICAGSVYVWN